jgi:hypothetical protein
MLGYLASRLFVDMNDLAAWSGGQRSTAPAAFTPPNAMASRLAAAGRAPKDRTVLRSPKLPNSKPMIGSDQ